MQWFDFLCFGMHLSWDMYKFFACPTYCLVPGTHAAVHWHSSTWIYSKLMFVPSWHVKDTSFLWLLVSWQQVHLCCIAFASREYLSKGRPRKVRCFPYNRVLQLRLLLTLISPSLYLPETNGMKGRKKVHVLSPFPRDFWCCKTKSPIHVYNVIRNLVVKVVLNSGEPIPTREDMFTQKKLSFLMVHSLTKEQQWCGKSFWRKQSVIWIGFDISVPYDSVCTLKHLYIVWIPHVCHMDGVIHGDYLFVCGSEHMKCPSVETGSMAQSMEILSFG